MKILCICERGNSRSVALAYILKDRSGHDAVAIGVRSNGEEVKRLLYRWAERILILDKDLVTEVPQEYQGKVKVFDVGRDRFFQPPVTELDQMLTKYIEEGL